MPEQPQLPKRPQDMTVEERKAHWAKVHVAADRRQPFASIRI